MNRRIFCLFLFVSLVTFSGYASVHETLPSWHWAYDYIEELRVRGEFSELFAMNRPYTRGEVAGVLVKIQERSGTGETDHPSDLNAMVDRLYDEFQEEMTEIRDGITPRDHVKAGL